MFNPTARGRPQTLGPDSGFASPFLSLKRNTLLVPHEMKALKILKAVSQTKDLLICPQVHLLQMFDFDEAAFRQHVDNMVKRDFIRPEYAPKVDVLLKSWSNKQAYRSVDFACCDPVTTQVLFGIEIDDPSHNEPKRKDVDEIKDLMFASVGLPLYRFTNAQIDAIEQKPVAAWEDAFDQEGSAAEAIWTAREAHFHRKPDAIRQ